MKDSEKKRTGSEFFLFKLFFSANECSKVSLQRSQQLILFTSWKGRFWVLRVHFLFFFDGLGDAYKHFPMIGTHRTLIATARCQEDVITYNSTMSHLAA